MNARALKVLVAGLGTMGQRHARILLEQPGTEVCAWRSSTSSNPLPRAVAVHTDFGRALEDGLNAVVIATPPHVHLALARQALRAGCDVFVEKPLSHSMDGVDKLLSLAREKERLLVIGYNLRFLPSLVRIKELLVEGKLGPIRSVESWSLSWLPDWRPGRDYRSFYSVRSNEGGGAALELSHEFDYLLSFLGDARTVEGRCSRSGRLEGDVEDMCEARIHFESGAVASVRLSFAERTLKRGCRIVGDEGVLSWDLGDRRLVWDRAGRRETLEERPEAFDVAQTYVSQMEHFLRAVRREEPPRVTGNDGLRALRVALEARGGGLCST